MTIDSVNISTYGLTLLTPKDDFNFPKIKRPVILNLRDTEGTIVYPTTAYNEPRVITLEFLLKGTSVSNFLTLLDSFQRAMSAVGFRVIDFDNISKIFVVYMSDRMIVERLTPYTSTTIAARVTCQFTEYQTLDNWANKNIAAYKANNTHIGTLEWTTVSTALYNLFTTNSYYYSTFSAEFNGDWFFYLKTSGNITTKTMLNSGSTLHWNLDGTSYNQDNVPNYTKGSKAGNIICSDTNKFAGITQFAIQINNFTGSAPNWSLPACTNFLIQSNNFTGSAPNWSLPTCTNFSIYTNTFAGVSPNWALPNCIYFYIYNNQFTGTPPTWLLPNCAEFKIYQNSFSGTVPTWSMSSCTIFYIYQNNFTGTLTGVVLSTSITNIQAQINGFTDCALPPSKPMTVYNLSADQFLTAKVDAFLLMLKNYYVSHAPTANNVISLNGSGMAAPSATGLTYITSIQGYYTAAGHTATINHN